jgi:hypothetical protein
MPESQVNVCAVVPAGLLPGGQARPPDEVVEVGPGRAGLADAVLEATATGATWLWLVDARVRPEPEALGELLTPLPWGGALGDPVLFASKVVGADGRLDQDAPPWPRLLARELAMAGADHRLAALRAARYTANRMGILRGDGWRGQEKAWFAFLFAQDLVERCARCLRPRAESVPRSRGPARRLGA